MNKTTIWKGVAITLMVILATTSSYYVGAYTATSPVFMPLTQVKGYSYGIVKEGSTYYAVNGLTGNVDYSGTNASQITQNAVDNSPIYGYVVVIGGTEASPISLDSTITLKEGLKFEFDSIKIDHDGIGFDFTACRKVNFVGKYLDVKEGYVGNATFLNGTQDSTITINELVARNGTGIYLIPHPSYHTTRNKFYINYLLVGTGCGIWMERSGGYQCQANDFFVNYINFYRDDGQGIYMNHQGLGTIFYGTKFHLSSGTTGNWAINNTSTGRPIFYGIYMQVASGHNGTMNAASLVMIGAFMKLSDAYNVDGSCFIYYTALWDLGSATYYANYTQQG